MRNIGKGRQVQVLAIQRLIYEMKNLTRNVTVAA